MRAAVLYGPFDLRVEEVPRPTPGPGEALVRIRKVGICGGDLHYYDGTSPYCHFPSIHGHEMVGTVEAVAGDSDLHAGELVTGEILRPCGTCFACRHGKPNCCANLRVIGASSPGAYAEYAVYPLANLHRVPAGLTEDDAVLTEPYSIGHHISHRAGIAAGETALVMGAGAIGLTTIDVLKTMGVRVIACDLSERRLAAARRFGADFCIHGATEEVGVRVAALTDGEGAAAVYEATGNPSVMAQALDYAAAGGTVVLAGITGKPIAIDGLLVTKKELSILGSRNAAGEFPAVLRLMAEGRLHQREMITRHVPLAEAPEAFRHLHERPGEEIKVVIEMA